MNFQFYLEKLFASDSFNKFKESNKDCYPCSGFFILDMEGNDNKQHFDYFVPSIGKMFSFALEDGCALVPMEMPEKIVPTEISMNYDFDFDKVVKLIQNEMEIRQIKNKIQKILLSLQNKDGKDFLVGTVFLSMMGLLKVNIDITDMRVVDFEKKSFMDMLRVTKKDEK